MSETQIYAVQQNGDVTYFDGAKNSWSGGMYIWGQLSEKYGHEDNLFTEFKKTWGQFNKNYYEPYEDIVLGSTFDYVMINFENINTLIDAFKAFETEHPGSNLPEQIEIIERMQQDPNIIGMAYCQTSVVDYLWDHDYDEDTDKIIPYNIYQGNKHKELFEIMGDNNE